MPRLRRSLTGCWVIIALGACCAAPSFGCQNPPGETSSSGFAEDREKKKNDNPMPNPQPEHRDRFAEDRAPRELKAVAFDGKRAMGYLEDLCGIGPRISGTEGMTRQQQLLTRHFEKFGAKVELQKFDGKQPSQKQAVPMANMIVVWNPDAKRRVIFCGHYDTRPIADQELRERDWRKPFLSANDGASTVAWLMELAHHMKDLPRHVGIDFVLFDGEEYINNNKTDKFFLGSDHFGAQYKKNRDGPRYVAAILLDLFAHPKASFAVETNSHFLAGELVEDVWAVAKDLGAKSFVWQQGYEVQDDHLALNRAGIPAIDIIDMSYPHWHKLSDTPDKCSGEKMAEVAKVLTAWVQRIK